MDRAMVEAVLRFGDRFLNSEQIEAQKGLSAEGMEQARQLGLFGLAVPEEFGGLGLGLRDAGRLIETLAAFDSSASTTLGLHNGLGMRGLIRFGNRWLQERYLPRMARGELIAAFSATEAEAGSHIANVRTEATFCPERGVFRISGAKVFVTNGGIADVFTVLVSTPGGSGRKRGLSLLLVPRATPGLTVGPEENKMGLRGSSTTSVYFEDVEVPESHLLGECGGGLGHLEDILSWGRTLLSAGCTGNAGRAHRMAVAHANTRRQFGQPLANFELIQRRLSEQAQTVYGMRCLARLVERSRLLGVEASFVSTLAKIVASEGACAVADSAIQIHGGSGYIEDTGVARLYRDARVTRIFEGANEMLRLQAGMQVLSWKSDTWELFGAALLSCGKGAHRDSDSQASVRTDLAQENSARLPELRELAVTSLGAFRACVGEVKSRLGFRVASRQEILCQISDMASSLFVLVACLLEGSGEWTAESERERADQGDALSSDHELIVMATCCAQANRLESQIAQCRRELKASTQSLTEKLAKAVLNHN